MVAYGTETMHVLRAEKGYIIVGQDTDGTVTPDDAGLTWAIGKNKADFVGKRSLERPAMKAPDRKQLVGLRDAQTARVLEEGAQVAAKPGQRPPMELIGHVTSSYASSVLEAPDCARRSSPAAVPAWVKPCTCPCPAATSRSKSHRRSSTIRRSGSMAEASPTRPPAVDAADWLTDAAARGALGAARRCPRCERRGRPVWGVDFSEDGLPCRLLPDRARRCGSGPDEYLLLDVAPADAGVASPVANACGRALERALADMPHALVNISHRQFALEVSGPHAATILSGACPLDLDEVNFPSACAHEPYWRRPT